MRLKHEKLLLEKLYDMGILSEGVRLAEVERKVGVSRMARRRLGVVMTRLGMSETVQGVSALQFGKVFGYGSGSLTYGGLNNTRRSNSSSKATSASASKSSPTLPFSSPATWRTLSRGSTAAR